jgi:hypothetical protein
MIYPFKKMIGNQVSDANNNTMLVPHLFGLLGGEHPYWVDYDWDLALWDGAAYSGQVYTGEYKFVDTEMLLSVNHEIAPKEKALGRGGDCSDCHADGLIDWQALGWNSDPYTKKGKNGKKLKKGKNNKKLMEGKNVKREKYRGRTKITD